MTQPISIVVPLYNEQLNVRPLYNEIIDVMANQKYEVIFINDGSTDNTSAELTQLKNSNVRVISNASRLGQSHALLSGIQAAKFSIIATLDGDLQNDPKDIIKLSSFLNNSNDFIIGYRKIRNDNFWKKTQSLFGNLFVKILFRVPVNDIGCGIKVFKKNILLNQISLPKNFHRYLAILFHINEFSVKEVIVNHRARKYGTSKYGINRSFSFLTDLLKILHSKYSLDTTSLT